MMRRFTHPRRLLAGVAAMSLILTACASGESGDTTGSTSAPTSTVPAPTTTEPPGSTTSTTTATTTTMAQATGQMIYLMLEELDTEDGSAGPFLVPVYRETSGSGHAAEQAMQLLLEGPSSAEQTAIPALSTAIPEGTSLIGVTVAPGLATVDLSGEYDDGGGSLAMFARLAQVVFTLTRLPEVDAVAFSIQGEPVSVFSAEGIELDAPQTREDYSDLLPPIFVDSPAWGEPVTSPIQVRGSSNVFEAVSQVMLTDDDGLPLFEGRVMASCGTGCRGDWETEIAYTVDREQVGALIVWEISAEDGSRINIREYPLLLR